MMNSCTYSMSGAIESKELVRRCGNHEKSDCWSILAGALFLNCWHLHVVLTMVFFSSLLPWEFLHDKIHKLQFQSVAL